MSIEERLLRGPATSNELQTATGKSQGAVSRYLSKMGNRIIKYREGRQIIYMMTVNAFGADDSLPLFEVDPFGNNTAVADIRPLAHGGFYVQPRTGMSDLLLGGKKTGLYDGLPYFLDDLRPQGFLGRQIAQEMARQSADFPSDPLNWRTEHVGRYLISNGDDLPGNFKFGQQAHLRVRRKQVAVTPDLYPKLARGVLSGEIPGSSAGGEQPKFTAFCSERGSHVIVKFTPQGDDAIARRWRDILITEFHATEAIHAFNFPAAETRLFEMEGRLFLESERFDRSGEYGRMSMVSLTAIDAEFTGLGTNWPSVMYALHRRELISWQHTYDAEILWIFGRYINNTDMHLGNLSLKIEGNVFRLLPVYDMCSMGFMPRAGGELLPFDFQVPDVKGVALDEDAFGIAIAMAHSFWERVSQDSRISNEFRAYLSRGNPLEHLMPEA